MLNDEMWKVFKSTGNINAYLCMKDCEKVKDSTSYKDKYNDKLEENEKILQGF